MSQPRASRLGRVHDETPGLCSRSGVGKQRRNEVASYSAVSVPFMFGWTSQKKKYLPSCNGSTL